MMANLTGRWLSDSEFRAALEAAGPLGAGMLDQLELAHVPLAKLEGNRTQIRGQLRELIDLATKCDIRHDRKARGLHHVIRGLIELADDEAVAVERRQILDTLFPIGLAVTQLPHIEEGGAALQLEQTVTPELRAKLAAIVVDSVPLDVRFDEWMLAARELSRAVHKRAELVAQSSRDGSGGHAFDTRATRGEWIRAVRGLLWVLDAKPALAPVRERVLAVLVRAIATAQRRSSGDELPEGDVDDDTALDGLDAAVDGDDEGDAEDEGDAGDETGDAGDAGEDNPLVTPAGELDA